LKSSLHYGHYLAQSRSKVLSAVKYNLVNLMLKNNTLLDKWKNSISIMLKKSKENIQVAKLRAILLLKVDFNSLNKIIYSSRVLPKLEDNRVIPYEVISGRRGQSS
jgi:hypothetical protein